jgi:hypothetical protein
MITKYGVSWPENTDEITMLLGGYRAAIDPDTRARLLYTAIISLWGEQDYAQHSWVRKRVQAWCDNSFQTWIGPASVAKSTDAAVIALTHWLAAPKDTMVIVCSTTFDMLQKRIWGEMIRYWQLLPESHKIGHFIRSRRCITLGEESGGSSKSGIFGVAIQRGTVKEAVSNLIGVHNRFNVLVLDELQSVREAAMESIANLSASGELLVLGIGNPSSRLDPLGRASEPSEGWGSVTADSASESWLTKRGRCYFWDGYKSPAIVDPDGERKYPFLLNQKAIDQLADWYGVDSPQFWQMRRGFFPPDSMESSVFTENFLINYHCMESEVIWKNGYITYCGIDPSFSSGGDRTVLVFARVGLDGRTNKTKILLETPIIINLKISRDEYISNYIAGEVERECSKRAVVAEQIAIDTTGQQLVLADILDQRLGRNDMGRVYRVNFGGKASERRMSTEQRETANELYKNRVTELWHTMQYFMRFDMVRGIQLEMAQELCGRRLGPILKPIVVESKTIMKSRMGKSPDLADAAAVVFALLRERIGIMPGGSSEIIGTSVDRMLGLGKEITYDDDIYTYDTNGLEILELSE